MKAYSQRLAEEQIPQSIPCKRNCHDNAPMENFFGLLKPEIYGVTYNNYEKLKEAIMKYIEYYNENRIKDN